MVLRTKFAWGSRAKSLGKTNLEQQERCAKGVQKREATSAGAEQLS